MNTQLITHTEDAFSGMVGAIFRAYAVSTKAAGDFQITECDISGDRSLESSPCVLLHNGVTLMYYSVNISCDGRHSD